MNYESDFGDDIWSMLKAPCTSWNPRRMFVLDMEWMVDSSRLGQSTDFAPALPITHHLDECATPGTTLYSC